MDARTTSRRAKLGLGGLASLCCLGPGAAAAVGGSTAVAIRAGLVQALVTVVVLALLGAVLRWRSGCSNCEN